jgi:Rrf2 family protein
MLSKKTKYAINALIYIAKRNDDKPIMSSEIATQQHIPKKFLERILLDLKDAEILDSKRGRHGGYFLNKSSEDINLADVMRLFDGAIAFLPCVTHDYYEPCEECKFEEQCGIRNAFMELKHMTVKFLKSCTLKDILQREFLLS